MSFASEYTKLNPAQKRAVDTIEGPVMVLAGPGTGKTHVLTLRIANLLKQTDIEPQNILALTFTDSAAKTMRERLITLIGKQGYSVRVETFHALCDSLIREYPEYFPFEREALPLNQLEQFEIIRELLDDASLKYLRTPGSKYHYAKDLVAAISSLKREGVTPERFSAAIAEELAWFKTERESMKQAEKLKWESLIGKHQELIGIYTQYQEKLRSKARYDFDDMLLETYEVLKTNPPLLSSLQEQFQYILVDEYQDTNGVQNAIVDLIAEFWGQQANLFVVGDPNQTIFRFQGALLENTLGFLDRYPGATVIHLKKGYRSNQQVYTLAHKLLSPSFEHLTHPLTETLQKVLTASHHRGKIHLFTPQTDQEEYLFLVQNIKQLLDSGVNSGEIAVLYRRNREGEILADLFSRAGLPFRTERDINVLENPLLSQFFTLLTLLSNLKSNIEGRLLFDVLSFAWFIPGRDHLKVSQLTLFKLIRAFAAQKTIAKPLDFLLQDSKVLKKSLTLKTVSSKEFKTLHTICHLLSSWSLQESKLTFPAFIELVTSESGWLAFLADPANLETLRGYIALFQEIGKLARTKRGYHLQDFLNYLTIMEEQHLSLTAPIHEKSAGITLATVHKAKGKEWQHVFVPFLREGYWGKVRSRAGLNLPTQLLLHDKGSGKDADERRLLFVALTRAKETLYLSYAQSATENGRLSTTLPSPYLLELPSPLTSEAVKLDDKLEQLFIAPTPQAMVADEARIWLESLVTHFPLSYSSLNAYLEDPKIFLEHYLLKLPEALSPHLAFGNAIHSTLEWYYQTYRQKDHTYPSLPATLRFFDKVLTRYTLTPEDAKVRREQGHQVLSAYLSEKTTSFPQVIATEESFGWRRGKIMLGDIELTGKIDRIDLMNEDEKILRVIDYKTGRTKSLGDIEGTTKAALLSPRELALPENIRGRLKRQLLFYKLLLSLDPKYRSFRVEEGIFEFVTPERGRFVSRSLPLLGEDIETLKNLIKAVSQEIRELKFLEAPRSVDKI